MSAEDARKIGAGSRRAYHDIQSNPARVARRMLAALGMVEVDGRLHMCASPHLRTTDARSGRIIVLAVAALAGSASAFFACKPPVWFRNAVQSPDARCNQ
jgi:hypothetical protein